MLKKFSQVLAVLLLLLPLISYLLPISKISAQTRAWTDLQGDFTGREYDCVYDGDVATLRGLECMIANVLMVIITLIGLAGFIMIIVSAFRWQLSGSNSKGTETARNSMTYALIGIILALSAYFILSILAQFTGISLITTFSIPEIKQ